MKKKSFLYTVLAIAVPVGLQSMLQSSFAMIDQLMVGQLGSTAVTAVEVAGRQTFLYSVVVGAVATIAGIMIAQYFGMQDEEMADRSLSVNLTIVTLLAGIFTLLCLLLPEQIVSIYIKNDPEILHAGKEYLIRIVWICLPMGISSILAVMIRCMNRAVYPLYAGISSALINTVLNYLFIFGHFGFPAMGVTGAALASIISQFVNMLLILLMFFRIRRNDQKPILFSLALGKEGYRQFILMLLPILINEFLWSVGQNINTSIYGHLAKGDLAAMSMTGPVQGLFTGALSGISQAAGILIGRQLGAKEYDTAYQHSKKLMWYGFVGSVLLSLLLICLRHSYVLLYHVEPSVQATADTLLLAFAILAPVKVANMILGGGIIRSGGKTSYIMIIDMIGTWLVGLPLGLITAFLFHLPIAWVYFILSQEELVRLLLTIIIFRRKKWMVSLS